MNRAVANSDMVGGGSLVDIGFQIVNLVVLSADRKRITKIKQVLLDDQCALKSFLVFLELHLGDIGAIVRIQIVVDEHAAIKGRYDLLHGHLDGVVPNNIVTELELPV